MSSVSSIPDRVNDDEIICLCGPLAVVKVSFD